MIKEDGSLTVVDEENNSITVYILFAFEVPKKKKKYIAYTLDNNVESEDINMLISEIDYDNNEIKSIPEEEMPTVLEIYNAAKESLLNEE